MKVTLEFDSSDPKSLASLAAITAALAGSTPATPVSRNGEARNGKAPATSDTKTSTEKQDEKVTLEILRPIVLQKSQGGKKKEVKELLEKYGADKLTSLAEEHYSTFKAEVEAL